NELRNDVLVVDHGNWALFCGASLHRAEPAKVQHTGKRKVGSLPDRPSFHRELAVRLIRRAHPAPPVAAEEAEEDALPPAPEPAPRRASAEAEAAHKQAAAPSVRLSRTSRRRGRNRSGPACCRASGRGC